MNHLQMFVTGLLAQEDGAKKIDEAAPASGWDAAALLTSDFAVFLLLLVTAVICFVVGRVYARSIRMGEMGWKIGLILTCLFVSAEIIAFKWPPRLGVDLKGGVVYMAQITPIADDENVKPEDLVPRLKERVDPTNTKEIMIRPYGSDMIEIVIPDVTDAEGDRIWENLTKQGVMQFRIVASRNTTGGTASSLMSYATRQASNNNKNDWVLDPNGKRVGRWVGIGRKRDQFGDLGNYRYVPRGDAVLRNAQTGQILNPPAEALQFEEGNEGAALTAWAESQDIPDLQIFKVEIIA